MASRTQKTLPKMVVQVVVKYVFAYRQDGQRFFRLVVGTAGKYGPAFPEAQLKVLVKKSPLITFRQVHF